MTVRFAPTIPPWATHIIHDGTAFKRGPQPVEDFRPLDLPDDAYFEYAFRDAAGAFRPDPLNDEAHNPWYDFARSFYGPAYRRAPYHIAEPVPEFRGSLQRKRLESKRLGQRRRYLLYTPAGHADDEPLPSVIAQDGLSFLHYGHLPQVLDALLADGLIRPARLVLVPPTDRAHEYAFFEPYQSFVADELIPVLDREAPSDGTRVALGASLGGLVSMLLARGRPDLFSDVATLSGAFLSSPETPRDHHEGTEWLRRQVEAETAPLPLRVVMFAGSLEWLTDPNRRLAAALRRNGYDVHHFERSSGHNWVAWRDALGELMIHTLRP